MWLICPVMPCHVGSGQIIVQILNKLKLQQTCHKLIIGILNFDCMNKIVLFNM